MLKVLSLFAIILFSQTALANDFLRSGKQLLICAQGEIFHRINWEDFQTEEKSFSSRSRNIFSKFTLQIDRSGVEDFYRIRHSYEIYDNGKPTQGGANGFSIGPDLQAAKASTFVQLHYIDKDLVDSEIPKICKI